MLLRRSAFLTADAGLLTLVAALAWWLVRSPLYAAHSDILGAAVTIDLTLTAALIHIGLGVAGARLPRWTLLSVLGGGAALAHILVPESSAVGLVLALVELGLVCMVGWVGLQIYRGGRAHRASGAGVFDAVERGLADALESEALASAAVMELRLVWLGLTGVFRRAPEGITMHRESGWMWVSAFLVALSFLEIPILHLLVDALLAPLAWLGPVWVLPWVLSAASAYGVLWLIGDAQALRLEPTRVGVDTLHLAVGLRWRAEIPRALIQAVEPAIDAEDDDFSVFGAPNVCVQLSQPVQVRGPFGIRRETDRFTLQVDDVAGLIRALEV